MGATNSWFNQGRRAPVSVDHWRSRKLPRKACSPQLVETYAASSAVVEMAWIKALWESMTWSDFNLLTQRRDSNREAGAPSMPFVVRDQNQTWVDPESTLVMDSKGLSDSLGTGRGALWPYLHQHPVSDMLFSFSFGIANRIGRSR